MARQLTNHSLRVQINQVPHPKQHTQSVPVCSPTVSCGLKLQLFNGNSVLHSPSQWLNNKTGFQNMKESLILELITHTSLLRVSE